MKTTILTTALIATTLVTTSIHAGGLNVGNAGGSIFVDTADTKNLLWGGETPNFADKCTFTNPQNGVMTFTENGKVWTTTSPASVDVRVRNAGNVQVTTEGKLRNAIGVVDLVDVDYTAGNQSSVNVTQGLANANTNINTTTMSVGNLAQTFGIMTISIGGTATHQNQSIMLPATTGYHINHLVTCVQ